MKNVALFFGLFLMISCNQNNPAKNRNLCFRSQKSTTHGLVNQVALTSLKEKIERKLIKTANITFETKTLKTTKKMLSNLIKQYSGYSFNESEYTSNNRISNTISARIPTKNFDFFLKKLSEGVKKVDSKNTDISDITERFIDVKLRLKNKKALEKKYLEILKKAKTVKEILSIEKELGKLREDIESFEGRLKYLQNQISFSKITITFYKKTVSSKDSLIGQINTALKKSFENIKSFLMYLIEFWPFIIISLFLIFYIKRKKKRKKVSEI